MQQKSELPEGWAWAKIGGLAFVTKLAGFEFTKYVKYKEFGEIPVIKAQNVTTNGFSEGNFVYVDRETMENLPRSRLYGGEVLLVFVGSLGNVGIVPEGTEFFLGPNVAKIKIDERVSDRKFIKYYIQSELGRSFIFDFSKSTTQSSISMKNIRDISVPLPPLPEQHRIVSAVEALFARLDATNEKLDSVLGILKKFRESVLAAACEGRLTAKWRVNNPDVEDPNEFLEKIKVEISKISKKTERYETIDDDNNFVIPETWNRVRIGEIETFIGSGITPKGGKSVYGNQGVPFIRSQNVYPSGLILDDIAYVTPEMHQKMKRTHVFPGDVLLNITGASIGRSTYVPDNFGDANVNQHVCIIRCGWWILPQYLSHFFNSDCGQSQIFKMQTGQTREGLNYTQIRKMLIALPPLPEQHEIVRRVDALFAFADSIEANVAAARNKTEKLRQSILAKAFSGQLVETEAEIARREGRDYETAEVLLERIKAEKGKNKK